MYAIFFQLSVKFILCISCSLMFTDLAMAKTNICTDDNFSDGTPSGLLIRVINENAPIFKNNDSSERLRGIHFGTTVQATKNKGTRFFVRDAGTEKDIGWMNREDLLCGIEALKAKDGLDERVFIKTEAKRYTRKNQKARYQSLTVFQSSKENICAGSCRKLSRFSGYFIFAKKEASSCKTSSSKSQCFKYLIADKFTLEFDDILVGWVSSDDVFLWNNAYGLRLSESFVSKNKEDYKFICGFRTLDEAKKNNKEDCAIKLSGGWVWYETSTRMLLQETIKEDNDTYYKVISPMTGEQIDLSQPTDIGLGNLKHIDVAFLVDGTNSMTSTMKGVRGVMKDITKKLPKGIQYRFAFQVYRDKYAGKKEFGDAYPFPKNCNANIDTLETNKKEFIKQIDEVLKPSTNDKKGKDQDHEENLFEGIQRVSNFLRGECPEHMKLLFIIGDTGYSPINQRKFYDRTPVAIADITDLLDGSHDFQENREDTSGKSDKPILAFFLQVENKKPKNADYNQAYKKFTSQANDIIKSLSFKTTQRLRENNIELDLRVSDYFFSLSTNNLAVKVSKTINLFAGTSSKVITEFDSRVQAGESPSEVIKDMMGDPRFGSIPARFVEQVILSKCSDIQTCNRSTRIDKIIEFYIKKSPEIIEDIWMRKNDYMKLLNHIRVLSETLKGTKDLHEKQEKLATGLIMGIEKRLRGGIPLSADDKGRALSEIYREKLQLAVPIDSPLFKIKLDDIESLPSCVAQRLSEWIVGYSTIMETLVATDKKLPLCGTNGVDTEEDAIKYMPPKCGRNISSMEKENKRILNSCLIGEKYLKGLVPLKIPLGTEFKFPSASMSIFHSFNNNNEDSSDEVIKDIMWVPKRFLP